MPMDYTQEILMLKDRVKTLELALDQAQTAISNLATLESLRALIALKQKEYEALSTKLDDLWNQFQILRNQVNS